MKYIDADLLRMDIDEWKEAMADAVGEYSDGVRFALQHFTFVLDSLQQEQPEVDLEKDVESWFFNEISSKINVEHTMYYYFQECARRYFERGKNSK